MNPGRIHFVDALKAIASQLIVLHHLAVYGPMSDVVYSYAMGWFDWLYHDARMAVQVFFVLSGFLTVRSLAPNGVPKLSSPASLLGRRYCRLSLPYLAAIVLSLVTAAVAREWMSHDSIPAAPTLPQFLAHIVLLHDVLGYEALSAGVWYVAIDFQLFALVVGLLWFVDRSGHPGAAPQWLAPLLLSLVVVTSLLLFNRWPEWDQWAPYFFGAYGLGALIYWASEPERSPLWFGAIAAIGVVALGVDFRERVVLALFVALALGAARRNGILDRWPSVQPLAFLGRISYSVFVVHYPVCLLVNALAFRFFPRDPVANLIGLIVAWGASVLAGAVLYHLVESRTDWLLTSARSLPGRVANALFAFGRR
jgi:peptidoglycan/LPS O-acetylase OafA/YrhL